MSAHAPTVHAHRPIAGTVDASGPQPALARAVYVAFERFAVSAAVRVCRRLGGVPMSAPARIMVAAQATGYMLTGAVAY